jgi:cytoskeletal protein RodZ
MRRHNRLASGLLLAVMAISAALSASLFAQSTQPPPSQTEQSQTEQSQTEQSQTEQNPAGQSQSQQSQSQQPAGDQVQNQTESASGDAAAQDTAEPLPDIDSQPIAPGARSNGRFIPSEQISQDLGVSFPVDI